MSYRSQQHSPARRLTGLALVVGLHGLAVAGLVSGLGRQAVEFIKPPPEARVLAELVRPPEPPKPEPPKPPPPKQVKPPPPAYVPPPRIIPPVASPTAVVAVTNQAPPQPVTPMPSPPPVQADPAPQKVLPVLDNSQRCPAPRYPAAARQAGEAGTVVLKFLIETDGSVLESQIDSSSGSERLDEAARLALSNCQFRPGTVDGRPEKSWARIRYVWKLQ